jgi:hypothetical protein
VFSCFGGLKYHIVYVHVWFRLVSFECLFLCCFSPVGQSLIANHGKAFKELGVPSSFNNAGVIFYEFEFFNSTYRWNVFRRFDQCQKLYDALFQIHSTLPHAPALPLFPAKQPKLLFDHLDKTFVEQRRVLLHEFMQRLRPFTDYTDTAAFREFALPDGMWGAACGCICMCVLPCLGDIASLFSVPTARP